MDDIQNYYDRKEKERKQAWNKYRIASEILPKNHPELVKLYEIATDSGNTGD